MTLADRVRDTVWPRQGLAGRLGYVCLRPLSELFGVGVAARNLAYRVGILRTRSAPMPIVSVGNLVVGGTGKTPFALWLGRMLAARGLRVGLLSRGYRGSARGVSVVSRGDGPVADPGEVGDEAVMLARSFGGPVVTSARRVDGAAALHELGCDVVVLDDGFQHRAIARDFDIVLVDGDSGALLPAGRWRERLGALRRSDAVVLIEREGLAAPPMPAQAAGKFVCRARFEPAALVEVVEHRWSERPLALLAGRKVVAVSGIARPEGFYELLRRWEAVIEEVFEFPDHHPYTQSDWQRITRRGHEADFVVTTEKDLVKLAAFPFATGKLVALRIVPQVDRAGELIDVILDRAGLSARCRTEAWNGD